MRKSYDVFVSHSTRRHARASHLVERLVRALERRDLEVFWDREALVQGDRLVPTLTDAIERSRAALIVHSRPALESPWVELEASIMRERRRRSLLRTVALRIEPNCRLLSIDWDAVIDIHEPVDITSLADTVAIALRGG